MVVCLLCVCVFIIFNIHNSCVQFPPSAFLRFSNFFSVFFFLPNLCFKINWLTIYIFHFLFTVSNRCEWWLVCRNGYYMFKHKSYAFLKSPLCVCKLDAFKRLRTIATVQCHNKPYLHHIVSSYWTSHHPQIIQMKFFHSYWDLICFYCY